MALIKSVKGRLPMNSGDYSSSKAYGKKYRCNLYGCEWESLVENNTFPPASLDGNKVVPDTTHWRLVSGVPENYNIKESIAELQEKVKELGESPSGGSSSGDVDLSSYAKKEYVDEELKKKADKSDTYTKSEVDDLISEIEVGGDGSGGVEIGRITDGEIDSITDN